MKLGFTSIGVVAATFVVVLLLFFIVLQAARNTIEKSSSTQPTPTASFVRFPHATSPSNQPTATPIVQSGTMAKNWTGCTAASQCTIAKGVCGPAAANMKYVKEFEAYSLEHSKVVDCAPSKKIPTGVACEKNQCLLLEK